MLTLFLVYLDLIFFSCVEVDVFVFSSLPRVRSRTKDRMLQELKVERENER